ncbi:MAG: hypothetical protein H3C40_13870 [Ignavibacterium sp.]|nr:hypothetical protein [Ignavibacterium sp.]
MADNYKISFTKGNTSFIIESTDKEWIELKEKEYLSKIAHTPVHTKVSEEEKQPSPVAVPQNLTINEFYKNYIKPNKITSRPDIAVFFIYYLEKILKKDTIRTGDVTQCFADVSYPNYNKLNMADILSQSRKKALLNNVNNLWSLTITGEDYVLNIISGADQ